MNRIDHPINAVEDVKPLALKHFDPSLRGRKLSAQLVPLALELDESFDGRLK